MKTSTNTRTLVEGAMMVALATILSIIKLYELPQGGSLTCMSMVPIVLMSYRHGAKWGGFTACVYSLIQLMMGWSNVSYCQSMGTAVLCILFDYIIAFTILGFAWVFAKPFKNKTVGCTFGMGCVGLLRFFCHYITGIAIWGQWAPEGQPVWLYSLTYNGSYMLPETIIAMVGVAILCNVKALHATEALA